MQKLLSKPDTILKFLLTAVMLLVPLYPKFPFIRIPGIYVAIRLEDFLIFGLGLFTFYFIRGEVKKYFSLPLIRIIAIYFGIAVVSLISASFVTHSIVPQIGLLHLLRRAEYLIPFFAAIVYLKRNPHDLEYFIKLILVIVSIVFIYGAGQKHLSWPVIITQNEEYSKGVALRWVPGSHIGSTFAGHYDLATYLVLVMPLFISLFFVIKQKQARFIILTVIFMGFWLFSNAVSRISIASYFIGFSIALALLKKYKEIIIVGIVSVFIFAMSTNLLDRFIRVFEVYAETETLPMRRQQEQTEEVVPPPVFEDRSTSIRLNVEWPRAIRAFTKNPILGTGYSSITLATDNDYLRLLGETGILGFLAFGLILIRILIYLVTTFFKFTSEFVIEKAFFAGLIGGTIGILVNALFIDVFEASKFAISFWFLIGIAYSRVKTLHYE